MGHLGVSSRRVLAAITVLATVVCGRHPDVPTLQMYGTLDPAVASLVAEHLAALRDAPEDANRWGLLGMTLEANGLTPQALDAYLHATTLPATHGRWWYHAGRLRARDGDTTAALGAFDQAIALSPDAVPPRWRRGLVLLDRGDLDGAEAAFRVAANLAPTDTAALSGLARVQIARGRHVEAIATLEALIDRSPADRYAYQLLATAYRGAGRSRDAEEAAAAGVSGVPQWTDPWAEEVGGYRRGFAAQLKEATTLGMAGRHAEAIRLLETLRSERPEDRELRTYLGGMYAAAGRASEAVPLLDAVLAQHPDDFDATMNLATARLMERRYADADRLTARALTLRPGDADALRLRGVVAWRAERLDEALRWLADAVAGSPQDAKAATWIGDIHRQRGEHAKALSAYHAALARDPLLPDALLGAATESVVTGAIADARRWLERVRRLAPGHRGLAEVEARLAARTAS